MKKWHSFCVSRTTAYKATGRRRKARGAHDPDRDAQFGHINAQVKRALP